MMTATAVHLNQSLPGRGDIGSTGVPWKDVGAQHNALHNATQQDDNDIQQQHQYYNQQNFIGNNAAPDHEKFGQLHINENENQGGEFEEEQNQNAIVVHEPSDNQQAGELTEPTGIEINTDIIPESEQLAPQPSVDSIPPPPMTTLPYPPNPVLMQQPPMYPPPYGPQMVNNYPHPHTHPIPNSQAPPMTVPMGFPPSYVPATLPQAYPMDQQMGGYSAPAKEGAEQAPPMGMVPPPMGLPPPPMMPHRAPLPVQAPLVSEASQQSVGSLNKGGYDFVGPRHMGTVKWFSATRGYGFIMPDQGDEDVFIHQSDILSHGYRSLRQGCRVEYCVEPFEDKSKAVQVTGPNGGEPEVGGNQFRGQAYGQFSNGMPPPMYAYPYAANGRGGFPQEMQGGEQNGMYPPYPYYGFYPAYPPHPVTPAPMPNYATAANRGGRGGAGRGGGRRHQNEHPMPYYNFADSSNNNNNNNNAAAQNGEQSEQTASSGLQIVVHNLSWACSWQELKDAFGAWNPIRADVIQDSMGRSRGFGVIKFASKEEAQAAIEGMSNQLVAGRPVTVRLDKFA